MSDQFSKPQLVVDNATVTYNNGHTAIFDASFSIEGGSICALVGINGSGKSTLFKTIMGLVTPTQGRVTLNDEPVRAALKKNVIAYVPQTEEVDWNFPVLVSDVVMMGRYGKMGFLRILGKKTKSCRRCTGTCRSYRAGSPPDRRAFRRPEKARVSGPRAGTERQSIAAG